MSPERIQSSKVWGLVLFCVLLLGTTAYLINRGVDRLFRGRAAKQPALSQTPVMSPGECTIPDTVWRRDFEARWKDLGRRMKAEHAWLSQKKIYLLNEGNVPPEYMNLTRDMMLDGLQKVGASDFKVEIDESPLPPEIQNCFKAHILDWDGLRDVIKNIRLLYPKYSGSIIIIRTYAAIETKDARNNIPFTIQGVSTSPPVRTVPPGGTADHVYGFAVVSDFFDKYVGTVRVSYMNDPNKQDRFKQLLFDTHRRNDKRTVHELYHIFGMPHHPEIKNPGFRETDDCPMVCGSVTLEAQLCDKCLTALQSLVAGISE